MGRRLTAPHPGTSSCSNQPKVPPSPAALAPYRRPALRHRNIQLLQPAESPAPPCTASPRPHPGQETPGEIVTLWDTGQPAEVKVTTTARLAGSDAGSTSGAASP